MEIATLFIAVAGVLLSALSLGWQAATHVLTGGRAQIGLRIGAIHHTGRGMLTARPESLGRECYEQCAQQGYTRPVICVQVRSVGRMPITVERWGIVASTRSEGGSLLSRVEAERTRGQGMEFLPVADSIGPPLPHRLEAGGASETWAIDGESVSALVAATAGAFKLPSVVIRGKVELGSGRTLVTAESMRIMPSD